MNPSVIEQREALRSNLERRSGRIIDLWGSSPLNTPLRIGLFAAFLASFGVLRVIFGAIPQNVYGHDAFIFLDGAWRVLHGQRPQVDFNSNLGPVMYLFTALGFLVTHHAAHALAFTQSLFGYIVGFSTAFIAFRRMRQVPAMLVTLAALMIAMSPANTGEEPFSITYAMMYNRAGYALLAFILIEATQRPRAGYSVQREESIGGMLSGVAISLLFFLKFTYAFMGLVLLIGLIPYRRQNAQRWVSMLVGVVSLSVVILAYLRFDIYDVARSVILGSSKHLNIAEATWKLVENLQFIALLSLVAALSAWVSGSLQHNDDTFTRGLRRAWAVGLASFVALGLLITNAQKDGLPLAAFMALIVASEIIPVSQVTEKRAYATGVITSIVLVCLLIPVVNLVVWNGGGLVFSLIRAAGFRGQEEKPLMSSVASDLKSKHHFLVGLQDVKYTQYINDGLALLRAHSGPNDKIVTMDFVNPFPFLLQRPPEHGGTTCLHYQTTFNEAHHLSPDELFGDADVVMWPKAYEEANLGQGIEIVYAEAARARFTQIAESSIWRLMRRTTEVKASRAGL